MTRPLVTGVCACGLLTLGGRGCACGERLVLERGTPSARMTAAHAFAALLALVVALTWAVTL